VARFNEKERIEAVREGFVPTKDFRDLMREQDAWMAERYAATRGLGPKEYVGRVVQFPYADGYAVYVVTGYDPSLHTTEQLELTWVDYGDGWNVDSATMRGYTTEELDANIRWTGRESGPIGGLR